MDGPGPRVGKGAQDGGLLWRSWGFARCSPWGMTRSDLNFQIARRQSRKEVRVGDEVRSGETPAVFAVVGARWCCGSLAAWTLPCRGTGRLEGGEGEAGS